MQGPQPQHDEFLQAYDQYADAIFRHCYYRVYDREKAKELSQECFMKTWEYLSQGKKVDNLRAFLYRVANNLIIDSSRKKKESSLDAMMEEGFEPRETGPEKTTVAAEAGQMIALLDKLDEKYRDVVRMRYLDDLSPKEIALALGESENVVSVRIHRGIKQLREYMA
ncbi:MAG TPA: RNA polymerase sigma factor [Candidatus Binatia bacterium]|jgi:RNA polymerase sigma-70 factor (ECF subfamily)|nr:RNA polymerase sigma factor [Candidatus Binatia bacterium]